MSKMTPNISRSAVSGDSTAVILVTNHSVFITAGLSVSYKLGPRWDDVITWSDFKSEAIFGFLSPNYMGHDT